MIRVKWDIWSVLSTAKEELEIKTHWVNPRELQRAVWTACYRQIWNASPGRSWVCRGHGLKTPNQAGPLPPNQTCQHFKIQECCCSLWRRNPLTSRCYSADCTDSCEMDLEGPRSFGKHTLPMVWNFAELFLEIPASLWKITFSGFHLWSLGNCCWPAEIIIIANMLRQASHTAGIDALPLQYIHCKGTSRKALAFWQEGLSGGNEK